MISVIRIDADDGRTAATETLHLRGFGVLSKDSRECLDHVVILGEAHLRRILAAYTGYYNELRTHLSLGKDSPGHRPIQQVGQITTKPILGGLHHQYCRM
jgi:hypothetical protein